MTKKPTRVVQHVGIPADDPRIIAARIAGTAMAEQYAEADSWYLLPPQFPTELLVGSPETEASAIMKAWLAAFNMRCTQIEVEFTTRLAGKE